MKRQAEWEKIFTVHLTRVVTHVTDKEYIKNYHKPIMKTRRLYKMGKMLNRDFTKKKSSWSENIRKYVQLLRKQGNTI